MRRPAPHPNWTRSKDYTLRKKRNEATPALVHRGDRPEKKPLPATCRSRGGEELRPTHLTILELEENAEAVHCAFLAGGWRKSKTKKTRAEKSTAAKLHRVLDRQWRYPGWRVSACTQEGKKKKSKIRGGTINEKSTAWGMVENDCGGGTSPYIIKF